MYVNLSYFLFQSKLKIMFILPTYLLYCFFSMQLMLDYSKSYRIIHTKLPITSYVNIYVDTYVYMYLCTYEYEFH